MPVVQSWDGTARRIYLLPDVTEFHPIEDVYTEYRIERRTNEAFRNYNPFMEAYGNIPKGGGKATPRYLVLLDGVKIVPYDQNILIVTTGEMISDNPEVDPAVFDVSDRTNPVKIFLSPADAEIVYVEIPSPISDNLDYGGTIHFDPTSAYSGITHPVGTRAQPVNNLADAKNLGALYGITELRAQNGSIVLDREFNGWKFKADSVQRLLDFNDQTVSSIYVKGMTVTGKMGEGNGFFDTCGLWDITNFHGNAIDCGIIGTISLEADTTNTLSHCVSMMAGTASPTIDMNVGNNCELSMRAYSGGLAITNCDSTGNIATLEYVAGKAHIDSSTNTDGYISVRGVVTVNHTPYGTEVNTAYLNNESIADAVLDEVISDHNIPETLGSFIRKIFWRSK